MAFSEDLPWLHRPAAVGKDHHAFFVWETHLLSSGTNRRQRVGVISRLVA